MSLPSDWTDLLAEFARERVDFVIVGGHAAPRICSMSSFSNASHDDPNSARVLACRDPEQPQAWIARAVTVEHADDVFDER